jgi:hypothetical protein
MRCTVTLAASAAALPPPCNQGAIFAVADLVSR